MKSLSKYPVLFPAAFIAQQFFSSSGSLILGEQIVHIYEFEDQLALSRVPLLLLHNSVFSLHLSFFIFLSPRKPPPQPPQPHFLFIVFPPPPPFYCFPSSSTTTTATTKFLVFSLPLLPISIVFPTAPPPPPPPHFQCTF